MTGAKIKSWVLNLLRQVLLDFVFKAVPSSRGAWRAQMVKRLPSAQGVIPGSWDPAPRQTPAQQGVCFSLSLSLK